MTSHGTTHFEKRIRRSYPEKTGRRLTASPLIEENMVLRKAL